MSRIDYDEIKTIFERFAQCVRTGSATGLDQILLPEAKCYFSIDPYNADSSRHGLYGAESFVRCRQQADENHCRLCNYACFIEADKAQQSGYLVCRAVRYIGDGSESIDYTQFYCNSWVKTPEGWRIETMRMDLTDHVGDFGAFTEGWFFEKPQVGWFPGVHLPCISGELDSPWKVFREPEQLLTPQEQVMDAFYRYAFGIDTLSFDHLTAVLSEDVVVSMAPYGVMDKRTFIATLKYQRQADRYWGHTAILRDCCIREDAADMRLYRMSGHPLPYPVLVTRENCGREIACATYTLQLRREDGLWKISRLEYMLGPVDIGLYEL
jgi:hypothetical protein